MNNITELNEVIYAGVKLVCDKIGAHKRPQTKTQNLDKKIRLEMQIRNLRQWPKW